MKTNEYTLQAEKRIMQLVKEKSIIKIKNSLKIADFYEKKSLARFKSARIIHNSANDIYSDYSEVVSACYYSMYYVVHSYIAKIHSSRIDDDIRGVHAITLSMVYYYLVKTKKIAMHLFREYNNAFENASNLLKIDDFQKQAVSLADSFRATRNSREDFTYSTTKVAEKRHASIALKSAEEFISIIRSMVHIHPQKRTS